MNWFHKHRNIVTSRELIGYGSRDMTIGSFIDIQPTNIYKVKGYCIKCKQVFEDVVETLKIFDLPQPYDKKPIDLQILLKDLYHELTEVYFEPETNELPMRIKECLI